jgi:hypothetical protein
VIKALAAWGNIKYQELSPEQKVKIFMSFLEELDNKHLVADYGDLKG